MTPLCSCLSGCGTSRLDRHRSMYRQLLKARSFGCRAVFSSPCPAQYVVKSRLATAPAVAEGTAETLTEADYDYPPVPFRASIDFKSIVENVELHTKNGKDRFTKADPAKVAQLYQQFVQLTIQTNNVRSERNTVSNSMKVLSLGEFRLSCNTNPGTSQVSVRHMYLDPAGLAHSTPASCGCVCNSQAVTQGACALCTAGAVSLHSLPEFHTTTAAAAAAVVLASTCSSHQQVHTSTA